MDYRRKINLFHKISDQFIQYAKADLDRLGKEYANRTEIPAMLIEESPDGKKFTVTINGTNPVFAAALAKACGHVSRDPVRGARQNLDKDTTTADFAIA